MIRIKYSQIDTKFNITDFFSFLVKYSISSGYSSVIYDILIAYYQHLYCIISFQMNISEIKNQNRFSILIKKIAFKRRKKRNDISNLLWRRWRNRWE